MNFDYMNFLFPNFRSKDVKASAFKHRINNYQYQIINNLYHLNLSSIMLASRIQYDCIWFSS